MHVSFDLINGIACGIEYIKRVDDIPSTIILDLIIFRLLFQWA